MPSVNVVASCTKVASLNVTVTPPKPTLFAYTCPLIPPTHTVAVAVGVFVAVFVAVAVNVGVLVGVLVDVLVGVFVAVAVFVGVFVAVEVLVGVAVFVGVGVYCSNVKSTVTIEQFKFTYTIVGDVAV